jgi:hypothetical protein
LSAKNEQTLRRLVSSIRNADRGKTSGYDTTATVRRVEDGIAWVHIPGGVDETPVKLTIAAAPGDSVQVRVSGGRAFLVGNATAPPTDDTTARAAVKQIGAVSKVVKTVQRIAERAAKIAGNTNQYFWHTESGTDTGAHITEIPQDEFLADPENGGGNLLLRSIGVAIRDGLTELAQFSIAGLKLFSESGVEFTNIGYGLVKTTSDDEEIEGPYYTFGTRDGGDIGYLSAVIGGGRATVYRAVAMCGGSATGLSSMACGSGATANSSDQVVFGKQNVPDTSDKYAFIIGNGTPSAPSNALTVDWSGNILAASAIRFKTGTVTLPSGTGGQTNTTISISDIVPSGYTAYSAIVKLNTYPLPYVASSGMTWLAVLDNTHIKIANTTTAWNNYTYYITLFCRKN